MKHLKLVMLLLLVTITIFSCYSIITDCDACANNNDVIEIWEPASMGGLPFKFEGDYARWITCTNDGNIWLSCDGYGATSLYLSTDNGDTWNNKYTTGLIFPRPVVNPVNGYIFFGNFALGWMSRSTDNGDNWEMIRIKDTSNITYFHVLGIIFTESGEMYIGGTQTYVDGTGNYCCYYSNDNGNTWVEKNRFSDEFCPLAVGKDGTLYASMSNGIFHSTDGGTTWLPSLNYNNYFTSITISDDDIIFGSVSSSAADRTTKYIVVKSTDKGVNWTKLTDPPFTNTDLVPQIIYNPVTKDIFIDNRNGQRLITPPHYEICMSNNLGEDWQKLEMPVDAYYDFAVNPKTGQVFIITIRGVYRMKNYPK